MHLRESRSHRYPKNEVHALALCCAAALLAPSAAQAADWPGFRGPRIDGIAAEKLPFAPQSGIEFEIAWKKALGSGYSGVSIVGDKLVTAFSDGKSDIVVGLRAKDGGEIWRHDLGPTYEGHDGSHTGPIATPLIVGNLAIVLGPRGNLVALNLDSGEVAWKLDLPTEFKAPPPFYGFGASPVLIEGVIILGVGGDTAIAGLDPASGKVLWKVGSDKIQYQTPAPFTWKGKPHVLAASDTMLYCIDPKSGAVAWEKQHGGSEHESGVLIPIPISGSRVFMNSKRDSSVLIDLVSQDSGVELKQVWEDKSLRSTFNLPILHGGNLYGYCSRFLTCVEPDGPKQLWRSRAPGDGFMLIADNRLIVLTKEGSIHIANASPAGYEEIAQAKVFNDLAWTPPSFANGRVYARSLGEIARIDLKSADRVAAKDKAADPLTVPGTAFAAVLKDLAASPDKSTLIDRFLGSHPDMPFIEQPDVVHFIYRGPAKDMAIAGDFIGARQEQPMKRVEGTDLFYYSTKLEPDVRASYIFYEDYKRILDPRNQRKAQTGVFNEDMDMSFTGQPLELSWFAMPNWRMPDHLREPSGPRGRIESHELDSAALGKKHTVEVYLPAGYESGDRRYPVLYVHGGEAAKREGMFVESLDNLLGKSVQPLIAVFIREGSFGQPKYPEMFGTELIPFIDGKYRTIAEPHGRANHGGGFSAFDAILCTLKLPGTVGKVAAQSLFIFDFLETMLQPIPEPSDPPLTIYIEWGRYDLRNPHEAWDIRKSDEKFVKELRDKGYKVTGGEVPDGTGWPSWRNRTNLVLETLFPVKSTGK
jgi:outer membrane protein assembly factor BamB/enterochelin esterase-like enzyme